MNTELLKQLSEADSVAGQESEVRKILRKELTAYADEVLTDGLGSLIFHKKGSGKKVMFAAHIDEVGFMIRGISDLGMCSVMPLGSVKMYARTNQEVRITTRNNTKVYGYIQSDYKDGAAVNTYIDLGMDTKDEVRALGITEGSPVVFSSVFRELGGTRVMGKAMDDRTGCTVLAEVLKQYEGDLDCWFCFTSSEEVGTRGSKTCADMIHPDCAFIVDVACWHSELDRGYQNRRQLGKGPMLVIFDKTCVGNKAFKDIAISVAEKENIPYQTDMFSGGGTDAGSISMSGSGVPTLTLGIPLRYCHTSDSICDMTDLETCVQWTNCILKDLEENGLDRLGFDDEL